MHAKISIAMRQVHHYVRETESEVTKPEEIMAAMTHDGGVANDAVELMYVNCMLPKLQVLRHAVHNRSRASLPRIGEFQYRDERDGTYFASAYAFSGDS